MNKYALLWACLLAVGMTDARAGAAFSADGPGAFDAQGVPVVSGTITSWDALHVDWLETSTYSLEFLGGTLVDEVDVEGERVYREYSNGGFRVLRDDGQVELSGLMPHYTMTSNLDRGLWHSDGEIIFDRGQSPVPSGGNVVYYLNVSFVRRLDEGYDAETCLNYAIYESVDRESWSESKARWRASN